jgi:molecular chaperone DnaK
MYNAAGAQGQDGQAGPQGGGQSSQQQGPKDDGGVTDVDFEEVK